METDYEKLCAQGIWPETRLGHWIHEEYKPGLVSVIIPTYNRADYLLEAMDSVFEQTYRPIELIVVDDGSTDDTLRVVEEWRISHGGDDKLFLRYFNQENSGAPAARNLGLIESRGEYIQFLDSDDLLHPEKLEIQVGKLAGDPSLDFVYSGTGAFVDKPDWDSVAFSGVPVSEVQMLSRFVLCPIWLAPSGVYSRNACIALGPWDERFSRCQDWEYNIRFILHNPHVSCHDQVLSLARLHTKGRISDSYASESMIRSVLFARKEVEQRIRMAGRLEKEVEWGIANNYSGLVRTALYLGYPNLAREIADWSSRFQVDPAQKNQTALWRSLAYLPAWCGPSAARGLILLLAVKNRVKNCLSVRAKQQEKEISGD